MLAQLREGSSPQPGDLELSYAEGAAPCPQAIIASRPCEESVDLLDPVEMLCRGGQFWHHAMQPRGHDRWTVQLWRIACAG